MAETQDADTEAVTVPEDHEEQYGAYLAIHAALRQRCLAVHLMTTLPTLGITVCVILAAAHIGRGFGIYGVAATIAVTLAVQHRYEGAKCRLDLVNGDVLRAQREVVERRHRERADELGSLAKATSQVDPPAAARAVWQMAGNLRLR